MIARLGGTRRREKVVGTKGLRGKEKTAKKKSRKIPRRQGGDGGSLLSRGEMGRAGEKRNQYGQKKN